MRETQAPYGRARDLDRALNTLRLAAEKKPDVLQVVLDLEKIV